MSNALIPTLAPFLIPIKDYRDLVHRKVNARCSLADLKPLDTSLRLARSTRLRSSNSWSLGRVTCRTLQDLRSVPNSRRLLHDRTLLLRDAHTERSGFGRAGGGCGGVGWTGR